VIHGMTGYGRGEAEGGGLRAVVEVRTVNHRHFELELRGALLPAELEARLKREASAKLPRGKIEVATVIESSTGGSPLRVNRALVAGYVEALRSLARELGLPGEVRVEHLAQLPWGRTFELAEPSLTAAQQEVLVSALDAALAATVEVRRREGEALSKDLCDRTAVLRTHALYVREEAAEVSKALLARLRQRVKDLLGDVPLDEARLAQEAAVLADRADIAEETTRLLAHLDQLDALLVGDGPCGKRLDFTLQEAFREINTMGSKSRGFAIASTVIDMKSEVERMREQVANVE
jgi:uncharacterized protein (TIGR00255 family)